MPVCMLTGVSLSLCIQVVCIENLGGCANCHIPDVVLRTQGKPGLAQCKRCRCVQYCGRQCQKAHWPVHRLRCTPATATK